MTLLCEKWRTQGKSLSCLKWKTFIFIKNITNWLNIFFANFLPHMQFKQKMPRRFIILLSLKNFTKLSQDSTQKRFIPWSVWRYFNFIQLNLQFYIVKILRLNIKMIDKIVFFWSDQVKQKKNKNNNYLIDKLIFSFYLSLKNLSDNRRKPCIIEYKYVYH